MGTLSSISPDQLRNAVAMVRSYDAVVIMGAGVSAPNYPMTAELPPLLWQAISDVPEALSELQRVSQISGSAKEILSATQDSLDLGWKMVRDFPKVRTAFQRGFATLDANREPSAAHFYLAQLIRLGRVECVISYNWDSSLERAYEESYGVPLETSKIYKPHGDVAILDAPWVLPDERGVVPDEVLERISRLSDRPRVLTVIGYSGRDEEVVDKLLAPLEVRWPVVRISPSATGEGAVPGTADDVLAALAREFNTRPTGWRYVTFNRSRGFEAALRGERLRPNDVEACPELPAAPRVADRLISSRFATISGASGTGKSITAFHAARRLNRQGWAVVELKQPGMATTADLQEFRRKPGPVLAVIDDAQAIDDALLTEFEAAVDDKHAVLLVSTERLESRDDETLSAAQAQQVLYDYCRSNIDDVGSLLSKLDDRVAKTILHETPKRRLEVAFETTKEPWLFMFVASGGDRRIATALDRAVDDVHPSLVFAFVCMAQMTSRDAGITRRELVDWAERFAPQAFDAENSRRLEQVEVALGQLRRERLIVENDGRIRAAHIRIADRALRDLALRTQNNVGQTVLDCLRGCLLDEEISNVGKIWLFNVFRLSEKHKVPLSNSVIDDDVSKALIEQCQRSSPGEERGAGLYLLWAVNFEYRFTENLMGTLATSVAEWLPDIRDEEVFGFRWILSGLRSFHPAKFQMVKDGASPKNIAKRFSQLGTRAGASDWSDVIRELWPRYDSEAYPVWVEEFWDNVDLDAIARWLTDEGTVFQPYEVYDLIDRLTNFTPALAHKIFVICAPALVESFEADLANATRGSMHWALGTMSIVARLGEGPKPLELFATDEEDDPLPQSSGLEDWLRANESDLRSFSASLLEAFESVNWQRAATSLATKELHEVHNLELFFLWLAQLSTGISDRIIESIPHSWLLRLAKDDSSESMHDGYGRFRTVGVLLWTLSFGPKGKQIARAFVANNFDAIDVFPASLIERYPDLAVAAIQIGKPVEVPEPVARGWTQLVRAVQAISDADRRAGLSFLRTAMPVAREGFEQPQSHDLRGIDSFFQVADKLDKEALDQALLALDVGRARARWKTLIEDGALGALAPLLKRASRVDGEVASLARSFL